VTVSEDEVPEKSAPSPPIEEAQTAEEAEVSIEQPMEPELVRC